MHARVRSLGVVGALLGSLAAACTVPPPVVPDSTPPVLTVPGDLSVPTVGGAGATVDYVVDATDDVDGPVDVTCLPESGTVFAVGVTAVVCEASDAAGNTTTGGFEVTVENYVPFAGAAAVVAGYRHSCALLVTGTVSCWGNNSLGQLGDGAPTNLSSANNSFVPVPVVGLVDVVALAAGSSHTCALLDGGSVSCWGWNSEGQLGDDSTTPSNVPVAVAGITDATAVAAGATQTCAVLGDGTVACWGRHTTNDSIGSLVPVAVPGISDAVDVASGASHSCAVLGDGTADCWGSNTFGALGNDTAGFGSAVPVPVIGLSGAAAVTAGERHSCAVLGDGTVSCWGRNNEGQLGDGSTSNSTAPVPVAGLVDVIATGAGEHHGCALGGSGAVSCWGGGGNGQLGIGTYTSSSVPVAVTAVADAISIGVGAFHSCAVLDTGGVDCWGTNTSGQLGNVMATNASSVPVPVLVVDDAL